MSLLMLFASAPAFSPARLFAAGEKGYWWDFADFGTMFQDIAGTIPVTATGQPVGKVLDKSGNGNTIEAVAAAARGVLQQDVNGFYYLDCDAVDDAYKTSAIVNHGSASQATLFLAFKPDAFTDRILLESSVESTRPRLTYRLNLTGTDSFQSNLQGSSAGGHATTVGYTAVPTILTTQYDYAPTTMAEEIRVRRNGAALSATYSTSTVGLGPFTDEVIYLAARAGATFLFDGRMYGVLGRIAGSTAAEISDVETWYNTKRCGAF